MTAKAAEARMARLVALQLNATVSRRRWELVFKGALWAALVRLGCAGRIHGRRTPDTGKACKAVKGDGAGRGICGDGKPGALIEW